MNTQNYAYRIDDSAYTDSHKKKQIAPWGYDECDVYETYYDTTSETSLAEASLQADRMICVKSVGDSFTLPAYHYKKHFGFAGGHNQFDIAPSQLTSYIHGIMPLTNSPLRFLILNESDTSFKQTGFMVSTPVEQKQTQLEKNAAAIKLLQEWLSCDSAEEIAEQKQSLEEAKINLDAHRMSARKLYP